MDRLPNRRELLHQIAWLAYLVEELAGDRNRLAAELATVLVDRVAS